MILSYRTSLLRMLSLFFLQPASGCQTLLGTPLTLSRIQKDTTRTGKRIHRRVKPVAFTRACLTTFPRHKEVECIPTVQVTETKVFFFVQFFVFPSLVSRQAAQARTQHVFLLGGVRVFFPGGNVRRLLPWTTTTGASIGHEDDGDGPTQKQPAPSIVVVVVVVVELV